MEDQESLLYLEKITKYYKGKKEPALKNISFKWNGGILGLCGPNGAGKSTLIKILTTLIRQSSGTLFINNHNVLRTPTIIRKMIGVCHEKPKYPQTFTVVSFLQWMGRIRGLSKNEASHVTEDFLSFFNLTDSSHTTIGSLSAGMNQKLGILQAIIGYPRLIILDEPTSNLDPRSRKDYEELVINSYEEKNSTFLISSHILGELSRLCTDYLFISEGECLEYGNKESLIKKYPGQLYRIMFTGNSGHLIQVLIRNKIEINRTKNNEIEIFVKTHDKLDILREELKDIEKNNRNKQQFFITPYESELEALYFRLNKPTNNKGSKI